MSEEMKPLRLLLARVMQEVELEAERYNVDLRGLTATLKEMRDHEAWNTLTPLAEENKRLREAIKSCKRTLQNLEKQFGVEEDGGCYCYLPKVKFGAGNAADILRALHSIWLTEIKATALADTVATRTCAVCGLPESAAAHYLTPSQAGPPWYPAWDHPFVAKLAETPSTKREGT